MNLQDRIAQTQANIEKMKKTVNETAEAVKKAPAKQKAKIDEQLEAMNAAIDELDASIVSKLDETSAAVEQAGASIQDKKDTLEGNLNATKENLRLAKEYSTSKLNSIVLRAQMNVNAAKAAINEKVEAKNKADQEKRIQDLLDYADSCQQLATAAAMEAEYAWLNAMAEAADYMEKYGE